MTTFVHIADERDTPAIRRNGLALPKTRYRDAENERYKWGVFALPVVEDFMLSHQWIRELKRRGHRTASGIYFRVADAELVWAGLYNQNKVQVTAAEAAARLRTEKLLGYEVIIPRAIVASEIVAIRTLPHVGWRFFPAAKGSPPRCLCRFCQRGDMKSRRLRQRLDPNGEYA
jgi:hypothetical protein